MSDNPNTQMVRSESSLVPAMGIAKLIERRQLVREALNKAMVVDHHYGVIPGTDKKSLLKPGAEMLLSMFGVALEPRVEEKQMPGDNSEYTVYCSGRNTSTGEVVGTGIGSASTLETKYAWKKGYESDCASLPPSEWRKSTRKGDRGTYTVFQIRVNPADVKNTVLKMAKKRAMIDFVLTAFAASDIFMPEPEDEDLNRMNAEREERESPSARDMVRPASVGNPAPGQSAFDPKPRTFTSTIEKYEAVMVGPKNDIPRIAFKFADGTTALGNEANKKLVEAAGFVSFEVLVHEHPVVGLFIKDIKPVADAPAPVAEKKDGVIDVEHQEVKG